MKYHPDDLTKTFRNHLVSQKLSDATIRYYISDVRVFLRFIYQVSGDYELTAEMFESYENFLKSGTLPTKTINRKLSSLRIFNTFLLKQGILKENIMTRVKNNRQSFSPHPVRLTSPVILFAVFLLIVLLGSFLFASNNRNLFSISTTSFTPSPVTISQTLQADGAKQPYLLRSQSLADISVEGEAPSESSRITLFGKETIPASESQVQIIAVNTYSGGLMFITPTSPVSGTYYVDEENGFFTLHLSQSQQNDFYFNWMLVANQLPIDKLPR